MGSPSDITMDCKPHAYTLVLKTCGDQSEQTQRLENFLSRLEEERLKIDAFKRELPLCMQLLTNAMEASRQQLLAYKASQDEKRPVLEEFIPIKNTTESPEKCSSDKATWMTTAQLWSQSKPPNDAVGFHLSPKGRSRAGFLPFSKERSPTLALSSMENEIQGEKCVETEDALTNPDQGKPPINTQNLDGKMSASSGNSQTHRKARRCWSPDLHRRFVNALQMLGGSQVATPKQIRELMKVDGLTNDEVKSHLQKYRLHTRRPSPSPQAAGANAPQLVVLGGIWVPPEYTTGHGGAYATPVAQTHYCGASPVTQDFYNGAPATASTHIQMHHRVYKAEHEDGHSDSIDDRKSQSGSWKGDNCDQKTNII